MFSSSTVVYFSILKHNDYTFCYREPTRLTVKIGRLPEPLNKIAINLEWRSLAVFSTRCTLRKLGPESYNVTLH